jgi:lysophospholipase L1-like esterase
MLRYLTALLVGLTVVTWGAAAPMTFADEAATKHTANTAAPKYEKDGKTIQQGFLARHNRFNERVKKGNVDLLFIGDSITEGWEGAGKDVWAKAYGKRNAVNLGIGGDRTQHVLWRLEHGNIDGISPKAAVLMIGTNNSNGKDHTAEQIAEGIKAIVGTLREKLPKTKVLILAIFPRGEKPNAQREKNAKASELAGKLADDKNVFYLDIGPKFLQEDGSLSTDIMPDKLHLSPRGYQIWADAIEPKLKELLGE